MTRSCVNFETHKCSKTGHIAPVCRSTQKPDQTSSPPSSQKPDKQRKRGSWSGGARWLGVGDSPTGSSDDWGTYIVRGATPQPPILINMEVCGKQVNFELDTGTTVTIMSEDAFRSLFPHLHLKPTNLELKTYTGQSMDILGEASVQVGYRQQQPQDLTLVVVGGSSPTLLGRNWLKHFRLNWNSIKTHQNVHLNALLEEYKDLFTDELGTIHPFKAKLRPILGITGPDLCLSP